MPPSADLPSRHWSRYLLLLRLLVRLVLAQLLIAFESCQVRQSSPVTQRFKLASCLQIALPRVRSASVFTTSTACSFFKRGKKDRPGLAEQTHNLL